MIDVLLIYPRLGTGDSMILDLPLSLLYAASESVNRGYDVKILDLRTIEGDWRDAVRTSMKQGVRLVGLSVMTGSPLKSAAEVSKFVREYWPETRIVWGGPHVTVVPGVVGESYIDFGIRGYGSVPLAQLIASLRGDVDVRSISGLSHKEHGVLVHNPRSPHFEFISYKDIPYQLVNVHSSKYYRNIGGKKVFSIFSSIGCPYKCAFCVHPTIYKEINGPKWVAYSTEEIMGHLEYVNKNFGAEHIVFLDDTSFPDIERMRELFKLIIARGLRVTIEFRGARVNEIARMDDDFLQLMADAGTRLLMVGGESGSDRMLKKLEKGITKNEILEANRKLARHPRIAPMYSFFYGSPGEHYEDIVESKNVILQLFMDNPQAYINVQGDWKPVPGTRTLEMAEMEYGYIAPKTTEEWAMVDSLDSKKKVFYPWYDKRINNMIKLMQVASVVIDDKIIRESAGNNSLTFIIFRLLSRLYKPIVMFRLKYNIHQVMVEYDIWRLLMRIMLS